MSYRTWYDPPRKGDEEPFPGSPDDMMSTTATLRARVAKLEEALATIAICIGPSDLTAEKRVAIAAALSEPARSGK